MSASSQAVSSHSNLSEDRYAGVFERAGDAMLLVGVSAGQAAIVDTNPAALNLFRTDAAQTTGLPLQAISPPQQPDGQDSAIAAAAYSERVALGETLRFRWRFLRPDQTAFDSDVTLSRTGDSENNLQLAIIRPMAEAEELLRQRTAQLDSVTAELNAFAYAVAHDLRAAILGIAACSRIVVDDFGTDMNAEAKRWLGHIHDDAAQLDKLTDALLELSRASRVPMEPTDLDLTAIAREVAGELAASDHERSVDLDISEGLKAFGDASLVRTLLRNLFDNAWKFTGDITKGSIEFGSILCNTVPRHSVFYVRDNGVGFDMAHADRLFVPFQRLHRDPRFGGNGIGLATVRRIAHRHGGKVWAEAVPGGGATFFFVLDSRLA